MHTEIRQAAGSSADCAAQPGSSAADSRQQTADSRQQTADSRQHCHIGIIAMRFLLAAGQAFIGHIVI